MENKIKNITRTGTASFYIFFILVLLTLLLFLLDIITGSTVIPMKYFFHLITGHEVPSADIWETIIFKFRIPKAVTAILAGIALSVSGLQMQTVFRNPLAGPYVLGISSGASLGVAILILGFFPFIEFSSLNRLSNWSQVIAAWIGSGILLLVIMSVSLRVRDIMTILILGILFGSATSSIVSILQYFTNQAMLKIFVIWSLGSLGNLTNSQLNILIPCILAGLLLVLFSVKNLNAMLIGEAYARSMGVNIRLSRILIFLSTSILAGSITAFCGPIGFIGIAVPHLTRMIFRTSDHKILIPGTILIGGSVMLLSDIISQLPGNEKLLPINSVTALLGIPIVVWIIIRNQKIVRVG